jgi:gamma-glutamyltranspeptidase/glutathione hydrolase
MVSSQEVTGLGGMVATAFPAATEAGWKTLQAGGNAVDAAVAAAWALCVCEPSGSGLGGQTVLLIQDSQGRTVVIDGHSYAPAAVSLEHVRARQQKRGYRACTIPSTPATLGFAQRRYGILPWARVLEPAIQLAEEGYPITKLQHRQTRWCLTALRASPVASHLFLRRDLPPPVGSLFRQKQLAATLRRIAQYGTDDFYRGAIARSIAEDMQEHGGLLTACDLARCKLPVETKAVASSYQGFEVASVPPPGGGLQLLLGLKVWQCLELGSPAEDPATWYAYLAEVIRLVFRDREQWPADLLHFSPSLYERLLGEQHVAELAEAVRGGLGNCRMSASQEGPGETTHLCAADSKRNVVSLTQSLQSLFGAKVANLQCGFLYNNYLTTCPRRPHAYQLQGGCRPRSNAAPTLVLRVDKPGRRSEPRLALGAAGSRRITSALLQVINAVVDRRLPLAKALELPRVHATLGGNVWIEQPAATELVQERLKGDYRALHVRAPLSFSMGAVQAIAFGSDGTLRGAADPRRDGTARGL